MSVICTLGAGRRCAGIRRRLGQRPLEARQQPFPRRRPWTPILSHLTENRDRCEFHVAAINPSAATHTVPGSVSAATFDTTPHDFEGHDFESHDFEAHDLGFDPRPGCEPLDCAGAATQPAEARIGST